MARGSSRGAFLGMSVAGATALAAGTGIARADSGDAKRAVAALIGALPGTKAASIVTDDGSFSFALNPKKRLVIASTFKAFVAVAALQAVEDGHASLDQMLSLDSSAYVPGSTAFTPELRGKVPLRVAIQEMIAYSDNAATDMVMALVGVERVRALIASAHLTSVQIPDSIRAFFSYVGGYPQGTLATYEELYSLAPPPKNLHPRPPANEVVTIKSDMLDLSSFYRRAMAGEFFKKPETLVELRTALGCGKLIELSAPEGSQTFTKAGSFENDGANGLVVAGAMQTLNAWVYYAIGTNWTDASAGAFARGEELFMRTVKRVLSTVRAVRFPSAR